ncbi:Ankyrin repeat domain-containing protein SOWAHC [Orchesella cincta]|uniref:Ankyrin repeat domain-containing protein SOWAHC n=1 Tax=Orchesella cincta TaxID=48709 RepID=A0A1D2MAD6_ORCCI|nr:Ankyrin repeat domain-containing protein SOWAHC [Orchesella cincta]
MNNEARIIFKTYVNKLANVKVENGEKFLVLKRQYFPPIDGNGNGSSSGLPAVNSSYSNTQYSQPTYGQTSYSTSGYNHNNQNYTPTSPTSQYPANMNSGGGLPPYGYPPPVTNNLRRQNSQSQIHGSLYSLNSNYADPYSSQQFSSNMPLQQSQYYHQQQQQMSGLGHSHGGSTFSLASQYTTASSAGVPPYHHQPQSSQPIYHQQQQLEYGLPAVPLTNAKQQPPHRHISPQNSGGSGSSSSAALRAPPPYRPPPPAANFGSPTGPPPPPPTGFHNQQQQHMRRSSLSSSSMTSVNNVRFNRSPSVPGPVSQFTTGSTQNINSAHHPESYANPPVAFQYQRSVSVSGLPGATQGIPSAPTVPQPTDLGGYSSDFSGNSLTSGAAPPPPVPPRYKRGVERSPSAPSSVSQNFGGNRHNNRRNMELANGTDSTGLPNSDSAINGGMENDHEKENINLVNGTNGNFEESSGSDGPNDNMQNGDSETEQKISVKERMQKFNRIASESELAAPSLSSLEPRAKEWMLKSAQCDYHALHKMAQENPALVRRRDMNTCLHWAAKKGQAELVKMLAGTYGCEVNAKSNGGYTPLHLAAQFSRQDVYDLLVKAYNADVNVRDHSGKKPMQYLVRQDTSVSMDTFKSESLKSPTPSVPGTRVRRHFSTASKIKDKRRSTEMQRDRDSSFLRIGSLNVKVKSTREAFGYLLGKSASSSGIERMLHKNWGSADNLPEVEVNGDKDKQMMPPPHVINHNSNKKKKTRRVNDGSPPIKETRSDSESDTACGFGSDWNSP